MIVVLLATLDTVFLPSYTLAAQQNLTFAGTVGLRRYCQIVLTNNGVLTQSADLMELSSTQAGGSAGIAEITKGRGGYKVSVDAPTGFTTMPADGDTGVTFSATYSTTGATTLSERTAGSRPRRVRRGLTTLAANFTASRTGSTFPAGNYSAAITVRCE